MKINDDRGRRQAETLGARLSPTSPVARRPRTIVFDIETVGNFDRLPADVVKLLREKHARTVAKLPPLDPAVREPAESRAALSPWSGRVLCVGMFDTLTRRGRVVLEGGPLDGDDIFGLPDGWTAERGDERWMLEEFWRTVDPARGYDGGAPVARVASFNGRRFDGPFLQARSFVHGLRASRNLTPYRYSPDEHADVADLLTGYGAGSPESLDVVCRVSSIESPKGGGMSGAQVSEAYRDGRVAQVAAYCARDVVATATALERFETTLGDAFAPRARGWR